MQPWTTSRFSPPPSTNTAYPPGSLLVGHPQSVVRASKYGFGLEVAIIGGAPQRFAPLVQLFHKTVEQHGVDPRRVAVQSHGFVTETDDEALERYYPY